MLDDGLVAAASVTGTDGSHGADLLVRGNLAEQIGQHGAVAVAGVSAPVVLTDWLTGREIARIDKVVLFDIRLPRMLSGVLIGAALAVAGALMQGLFRNPLADPGLLGVSAGASLGAISAIVLGASLPPAMAAAVGCAWGLKAFSNIALRSAPYIGQA